MHRILSIAAALFAFSAPVLAECVGQNLISKLPLSDQAALRAKAEQHAFAVGNYWRATKAGEDITLIGTYHLDDPRHIAVIAALAPDIARAKTLLVEAGPKEQDSFKARMADDPSLIVNTDGPTLPEILSPEDWQHLSQAARARGMPAFMIAKFRPWYVSLMLAMPPCSVGTVMPEGLDAQLIAAARARDLPVQALEPYDTLFSIFGDMTQAEQIDMITSALALEDKSADMAITLADAYFAEEGRLIWEFSKLQTEQMPGYTPERVAKEFAVMEKSMMTERNQAWIPVITKAAAQGPVLVGFGALHLSGDSGVLNLLQAQGYSITRLPIAP